MKMTDSTIRFSPKIRQSHNPHHFHRLLVGGQCVSNQSFFFQGVSIYAHVSMIKLGVEPLCQLLSCPPQGEHHGDTVQCQGSF